jgi:response regulator RpfG family c-di-GMP phosphodiesterase
METPTPRSILVVHGDSKVREALGSALSAQGHQVQEAPDQASALEKLRGHSPDVIILGLDSKGGGDRFEPFRSADPDTQLIAVSGAKEVGQILGMWRNGATDVILDPFRPEDVCAAVARACSRRDALLQQRTDKERAQTLRITWAYRETLWALRAAVDARMGRSHAHSTRLMMYARALAQQMGLSGKPLEDIEYGVFLHDLGEIAIPDSILKKPGRLTEEEWSIMRRHPEQGVQILAGIEYFATASTIVYCHHERWDGTGYPRGLKGEQIPLGARIFTIVDALDAMTSDRPYRKALTLSDAREEIKRCAGSQFDPRVVEHFLAIPGQSWFKMKQDAETQAEQSEWGRREALAQLLGRNAGA